MLIFLDIEAGVDFATVVAAAAAAAAAAYGEGDGPHSSPAAAAERTAFFFVPLLRQKFPFEIEAFSFIHSVVGKFYEKNCRKNVTCSLL
jgi:hypothetical protein